MITIDTEIDLNELTPKYLRVLNQFAPFGPMNMRPVFLARQVQLSGQPRIVGKNHLRMKIKRNGTTFDAIGFNLGHLLERAKASANNGMDIVFSVDETNFSGTQLPQLKIKDLK